MAVYFEFIQVGAITKVTAIDATTGTEVVIQGPTNQPQHLLQQNALAKLNYVLAKQKKGA